MGILGSNLIGTQGVDKHESKVDILITKTSCSHLVIYQQHHDTSLTSIPPTAIHDARSNYCSQPDRRRPIREVQHQNRVERLQDFQVCR